MRAKLLSHWICTLMPITNGMVFSCIHRHCTFLWAWKESLKSDFSYEVINLNFGIQLPKSKIWGIKSESELCWNTGGNEERSPCSWAGPVSPEQQWEQWGFLIPHVTKGRIKIILEWLWTYCRPSFLKQKFNLLQESMTKWWLIKTGPSIQLVSLASGEIGNTR